MNAAALAAPRPTNRVAAPVPRRVEVVYTPEAFGYQRRGGISRYFAELVGGMQRTGWRPTVLAGLHANEHARDLPNLVAGLYAPRVRVGRFKNQLTRRFAAAVIRRRPGAILHQTYTTPYAYPPTRRLVFTVFDMLEEVFPENCFNPHGVRYYQESKATSCRRADHLIAISESTKTDLVRLLGIDPRKVTVTPLASSLPTTEPGPNPEMAGRPYLLFVGQRRFYKNFDALLDAYASSTFLRERFELVCFGGGPFSAEETARLRELNVGDRAHQRGGDDGALARHYRDAAAFVYPTLYEGFGLPILEAMGLGCPVFCGQGAGSVPEVAGEAADYFDPRSPASIRATLEGTLDDGARLEELRRRGPEQARCFSWERCVRETQAVYTRLAEENP